MSVALLPSSTIRLVTTTQIITTVSSVVKELIENSLDAGATNIEVRLERNGLEKIEIKDNGCGIKPSDVANVCLSSYTSKIQNYSDLGRLSTYGFRGEALSSLCQVSSITITTKTASDNIAMTYMISQDGSILNSRPSHFGNVSGTHIVVTDLFKNLPVRKQYLSNSRNAAEDIRRTEQIVKSIAVIHPEVRITFCHNKCSLWQKPVVATLQESYMQIFGYSISSNLEQLALRKEQVNFELLVPLKNCTDIAALCQASSNSIMTYFNKRPVKYAKIEKVSSVFVTTKIIKQYFGPKFPQRKYPICVVSVTLPADLLDVNLEPNKTKVFCKEEFKNITSVRVELHLEAKNCSTMKAACYEHQIGLMFTVCLDMQIVWLLLLDKEMSMKNKKITLLVDNCSVHNNMPVLKKVELCYCPPNNTLILKPLDVGIIKNLQTNYHSHLVQHVIASIERKKNARLSESEDVGENVVVDEIMQDDIQGDLEIYPTVIGKTIGATVVEYLSVDNEALVFEAYTDKSIIEELNGNTSVEDSHNDSDVISVNPPPLMELIGSLIKLILAPCLKSCYAALKKDFVRSEKAIHYFVSFPCSKKRAVPVLQRRGVLVGSLHLKNTILSSIEEMLIEYYGLQNEEEDTENCKQPVSKINRKLKPQSTVEEDRPIKRSKLIAECPSTLESSQNPSISTTALPTQSKNLQIGNENIVDHGAHSKQSENPQNANGNIVDHNGDRTVVESLARVCQESAMAEFLNSAENKETEHCDVLQGIKDSTSHDGDNELKTVESRDNFLHSSLDLPKNSTVTNGEVLATQLERETGQIDSVGPEQRGDMQISKSKDSVGHETVTDMTEHTKIHNDTSLRIESSLFNMLDDIEDVFFGFDTPEQDASQRERERAKQALEAAKSVETTKMGKSANLEDLNKEQWSKGSIKTKNGCTVEGAKLLLPKVNKSKKEFFDLSLHSVSSQMGCKEQSAFTKFSRHMRPKLLEENPGVAFTKVASLLVEHWKQLTDEEKSKYEEIAREEEERKHNVPTRKSTEKICSPSVVEMLNTTPMRKPPLDDLHSVDGCVPCSMTEINQKMEEIALKHRSSGKGSGEIFVIGQIRPHGVWLYMKNREIGIIRHWALQETVEFHKMMKETTVPLAPVMNNIPLRPSLLGPELWNIFTSLEHSFDTASGEIVVSSPFISKNGFRIVISEGPDDDSASISHIASTVRFYDVMELKEILQILKVKGSNCALEHCRPLKILNYFKSEAVTICRKAADTMNYSDLTTNLMYWEKYLKEQSLSCLHRKQIFVPFHTINS
ncbi:PMS1 protein homolog 1-like [Schistocerca piceifrons]|uniref:PMS1 protein homolog 1-like n=1 Tax=Schistocerca piceifrons TaxID=274613 RepID=UPI001F5ED07A|nr:PMS1 protein homolog 1-like [Schistocerca piceifrons]